MTDVLPSEILDRVVDFCHPDWPTLRVLAITSRLFLSSSRFHRFTSVTLSSETAYKFLSILDASVEAADMVHALRLVRSSHGDDFVYPTEVQPFSMVLQETRYLGRLVIASHHPSPCGLNWAGVHPILKEALVNTFNRPSMRHVTIVLTPDFGRKFILACPALKGLRLTGSRSLSLPEIPSTRRPILQSLRTAVNIWNSLPNPASLPFDISQLVSFGLYGVPLIQESWIRSFLAAAPYLQELGYSPSGFDENYLSKVTALPLSHTKSLCTIVLFAEGRVPLLFLNQFLSTSVPPPSLKNLSILLPYGPEYMSALGKIDEHLSSRPWINVPNISILLCASVRTRNDQRVSQALRRTLGQREIVIQWMPTLVVGKAFWA